jgi:hypothetical protein
VLGKWHLNIVSTFTSQFLMLMGEAEETINTKCGPGGLLSTLDPWKLDVIYTISDQIAIANSDALRIDCLCCLEATQKIEDFCHCTSVGVGSSQVTIGI